MNNVKNFLSNYENEGTRTNLRTATKLFFQSLYDDVTLDNFDEIAEKYFSTQRGYEKDVQTFLRSLNGLAPLIVKHKLSSIKTFLLENIIDLPQKFWKKVSRRIKGSRALTLNRIPTTNEFKKTFARAPHLPTKLYGPIEKSMMRNFPSMNLYRSKERSRL